MPRWEDEYNLGILNARNAIIGANGRSTELYLLIYRAVAEALLDLDASIGSDAIRKAIVRRNVNRMLVQLERLIPTLIDQYQDTIIREIAGAHVDGLVNAVALTGGDISDEVYSLLRSDRIVANALEYYPIRQGLGTNYNFRTLINLRIEDLQSEIDRLIASGINRGISADRLTQEIAVLMSKNDPEFQQVLRNLGPRGGAIRKSMRTIPFDEIKSEVPRARKFLHQARRIAVSEINNAYNEADRLATEISPVVQYNRWEVSSAHYGLPTTPDVCTYAAETDQFGLGVGVFYVETTPSLFHPFCACYTSKIFKRPDQWLEPRPEPKAPRIRTERGARRFFKGKTTAHRERNIEISNNHNRLAYEFYLERRQQ